MKVCGGAPLQGLPHRRDPRPAPDAKVALRRLRQLTRDGPPSELDLDETIDETCRNAGEIELVFRPPRRNNVRLLLLMDVGGTMDPYFEPVSRLLTALHEERGLRELRGLLLPQLHLRARLHATPICCARESIPTGDLLPPARLALEGADRRRRRDASGGAARGVRQHRPAPRRRRRRASTGCTRIQRALRARRVAESRPAGRLGVDAHHAPRRSACSRCSTSASTASPRRWRRWSARAARRPERARRTPRALALGDSAPRCWPCCRRRRRPSSATSTAAPGCASPSRRRPRCGPSCRSSR